MNDGFGEAALRLAGLAARALGWGPDMFWNATPVELAAALADPRAGGASLDRATLERMMEDDRHG